MVYIRFHVLSLATHFFKRKLGLNVLKIMLKKKFSDTDTRKLNFKKLQDNRYLPFHLSGTPWACLYLCPVCFYHYQAMGP